MFNIIRADLFKMRKSQVIKILFGITTLGALAMMAIAYLIPQGQMNSEMTGIGFMFSDVNIISIIGAVIAGVFICGDFDNKTIHDAIACGRTRAAITVSKAMVFFSALVFMLLPYGVVTGIGLSTGAEFSMGSVSLGFLNILTKHSGMILQAPEILKLIIIMVTLGIVYAAQLSICVPLALVLKKPVLVVAINYVFQILCAQLAGLSSTVFKCIFSFTPYGGNYTLLSMEAGTGDIVKAILVSLAFIMLMLTATYSIFRKSEIK